MLRQLRPAISSVLVFTLICGVLFPLAITVLGRVLFPRQANGSLVLRGGKVIGSELIGQQFEGAGYFHPRPSAAGSGYDATASGGTNLGPTSAKLIDGVHAKQPDGKDSPGDFDGVKDLAREYREQNGLDANALLPADAVTRSASGLDPHISPANARLQAPRIAHARNCAIDKVTELITANTEARTAALLGEPRVNVLKLNMALDARTR